MLATIISDVVLITIGLFIYRNNKSLIDPLLDRIAVLEKQVADKVTGK